MRAVIFANGVLDNTEQARQAVRPGDWIIAADGGASHCRALGLTPAVLIGDFDSLSPAELQAWKASGVDMVHHPARKDFTDLELAMHHAIQGGAGEILVLGALGARWDQTLANLLLPASVAFYEAQISLLDGPYELAFLSGGQSLELRGQPGDTVSLIPLRGDALGVTTHGLEYPLQEGILHFGATRGVSNVLQEGIALVELKQGNILCVLIHKG